MSLRLKHFEERTSGVPVENAGYRSWLSGIVLAILCLITATGSSAGAQSAAPAVNPSAGPAAGLANASATPTAGSTITTIQQIVALTNAQAAQSLPVRLEGTVTFLQPEDGSLFVQDGDSGSYVNFSKRQGLLPGDRVVVVGVTNASFRPEINADSVEFLAHGSLPKPVPAVFEDLIETRLDSRFVVVRGHVLAVSMDKTPGSPGLRMQVKMPNGILGARVAHPGGLRMDDLLDADVRLTGVAGGQFDGRMQMAGVWLDMNAAENVTIEHRPSTSAWNLPATPMDRVIYSYRAENDSRRVRITGTLTYFESGEVAVLEKDGQAILIATESTDRLQIGSTVEAIGFPELTRGTVQLIRGQVRPLDQKSQIQPQTVTWDSASAGKYSNNLITLEGEVANVVADSAKSVGDSTQTILILKSGDHLFSASLHPGTAGFLDSINHPELVPAIGSRIRITGVCFVDAGDHWSNRLWFDLRMRSMQDITVIKAPDWWNTTRLTFLSSALSVVILVAFIWAGMLDRRLRRQNEVLARQSQEDAIRERRMARQEQQRSNILELISSSEPLEDVLSEIAAMVSSRLLGASCWFELHLDGQRSTDVARPSGSNVVYQELFAPDGTNLGMLLATPLIRSSSDTEVTAALSTGARLAELAIDTRRLYSDLRHRSEYDLLTDIPNRFSLERHLDRLIQAPEQTVFGLVYLDLDKFKQINDRYGHRTGDLYLQVATGRMKFQLRSGDILARIGGDEFIALVPGMHSRADAEEIAMRLERCFDEPFEIEGIRFLGSVSLGLAVYPEDGVTKEELQRSADAAMYANKEAKHTQERVDEAMQRVWTEDVR